MLGKVFKHEMKSSSRLFLPMMAGFLAITLLTKFSFETSKIMDYGQRTMNMISGIFMMLYFTYAVALFVLTSVFIVMHFYKTMVSEQGYLTHTLPVKTSTLINAKIIAAILWQFAATILFFLSIIIFVAGHVDARDMNYLINGINRVFHEIFQYYNPVVFVTEVTLYMIASILSGPLMMYASIALGHLFNKHRVLLAIVCYFAIYIAMQIISTTVLGVMGTRSIYNHNGEQMVQSYFLFRTLFSISCAVGFYAVTDYIFSKKLNLE